VVLLQGVPEAISVPLAERVRAHGALLYGQQQRVSPVGILRIGCDRRLRRESVFSLGMSETGAISSAGGHMFGWFKKDPEKKLQKQIAARYLEATAFQRNGKLREYADVMADIARMEDELMAMGESS
jgi:hypothetical protein